MQPHNQPNNSRVPSTEVQELINKVALKSYHIWIRIAKRQMPGQPLPDTDEPHTSQDFKKILYDGFRSSREIYGDPKDWYQLQKAFGYIDGFVQGKIANRWSFIHIPPPEYLDYLIWFQSFRSYASISNETRIRANRLYTHLKNKYQTLGHFLKRPEPEVTNVELNELHALSDIKVEVNWKNFEALFERFFPESIDQMIADFPRVLFPDTTRLFTTKELQAIYDDWKKTHRI